MTETKICPLCGAKDVEYKHGMTKGLVRCLYRFAQAHQGDDFAPVEISDIDFNYSQRCNFSKIRYWGLIEKAGDGEDIKKGGGGLWRFTAKGLAFVMGTLSIPKYAWTHQGEAVRLEGEEVFITDVTDGKWKYRPDYAQEAQPHES